MRHSATKRRSRLKQFAVGYYLEEGFSIGVNATSAEEAETIVRNRLDDERCELAGSERVHYDDGITDAEEVRS